jgi:hypothetical protein
MCEKCEYLEKKIAELSARVAKLEGDVQSLSVPEYVPDKLKVEDWVRARELHHKEKELELEIRRAREVSEPVENDNYAERLSSAVSRGFYWPTRHGAEPSRLSTKKKILGEWEKQYETGQSLTDDEILNVQKVTALGSGAIQVAVSRLKKRYGNALDPDTDHLNLYNTYQKLVKISRTQPAKVTTASKDYTSEANALRDKIFGHSLSEENSKRAGEMLLSRIQSASGVANLTPEMIKQCCNLERLPVFFPWDPSHLTPNSKLQALKRKDYDNYFSGLIESFGVESQ